MEKKKISSHLLNGSGNVTAEMNFSKGIRNISTKSFYQSVAQLGGVWVKNHPLSEKIKKN